MKHITISYIFYVSLLGSFCLGSPQQSNRNNGQNVATTGETTTAEPINKTQTTPSNTLLLTKTSTVVTTQKSVAIDTTTAMSQGNVSTTTIIHHSQSMEASTQSIRSSSVHTTTAMPIKSSSSIVTSPERQFDVLSFMGGSVFTFCLMAIGIVLWKAYKMQIERNYRTI